MKCPGCGTEVDVARQRRCPECGAVLPRKRVYVYGKPKRLRLSTEAKVLLVTIGVCAMALLALALRLAGMKGP